MRPITILLLIFGFYLLHGVASAAPSKDNAMSRGEVNVPPDFFVRGELQQGGFMIGRLPDISGDYPNKTIRSVIFHNYRLPLLSKGDDGAKFFIAFERMAPLEQTIVFVLNDGERLVRNFQLRKSQYDIQRIDGVKNKYVNPDPKQVAMIKQQNRQVVALRGTSDNDNFSPLEEFIWPAEGQISGVFGSQRIFNGEPRRPHYGVDLALDIGTPVMAPQRGRVILAKNFFLSGKTMVIDHGIGVQSVFLHLDDFKAKEGEAVKQGQVVATSGNTGRSTGPHLHWQVNWYYKKFNAQLLPKNKKAARN
ncbi:MAG: M23 family metallopeptidase [Alphaproteobacteria bacterium]